MPVVRGQRVGVSADDPALTSPPAAGAGQTTFMGVDTSSTNSVGSVVVAAALPTADMLPTRPDEGSGLAVGAAVHATIDAAQTLRTVDDRMFGANTAVWDGMLRDARTLPLVQAIDLRTLRFPGGSTSDTYDWQTNKSYVSSSDAAYVPGVRTLNSWSWTNTFDQFAPVALSLHATVFITANYGTGTAQQAADWVTYSNVTKGYGFKYWEIGNECYGGWEEDVHAVRWDPVTYATEAKDYIAKMKAADPSIKIGVVVQTGEDNLDAKSPRHDVTNPRTGVAHHGWTPVMLATLKTLGVTPDYVIYHRYPLAPGSETDAKLLAGTSTSNTTWADDAADLRRQVNDYLGAAGAGVELVVTENNDVYSDPGKQSTSLVNGLFYADSFGQLLQTEFKAFVWWALHNGSPKDSAGRQTGNFSASLYGWRTYGDYGVLSANGDVNPTANDPHPTYYAMKLISHFMRAGDQVVRATSDEPLLAVYAARRTVDGTLTLLVINKSPSVTTPVNFTIAGFVPRSAATVYSYGIPQDEAARTGTGAKDLATTTLSGAGAAFSASFEPYSMSVVVLAPAVPAAPAQLVGYAAATSEITLTWQTAPGELGITGYKLERATDSAFTQNLTTWSLDAATSYTDTGLTANTSYYYRVSAINDAGVSQPAAAIQVKTLASAGTGPARLVNIATRAYCSTGNAVTIGGFVISGSAPKQVLVRAVGPSLAAQGIGATEVLLDPTIEVHDALHGNAVVATNDNVSDNLNAGDIATVGANIGATPLLGTDTKSAALLTSLNPGIYSFVVRGKGDTSGIVLLEVYDADATASGASFVNIATRADCTTNNGVTIGGFVIAGGATKQVLVRAVGPTLLTQGIGTTEVLTDPTIELHDAIHGNAVIATNDNWSSNANAAAITATGARIGATPLAESDTTSAALLLRLPPGIYSFVVKGRGDTTGITLIEVYDAD